MKRTVLFCDRHEGDDDVRADETVTFVTVAGTYEVDLCVEHKEEWVEFEKVQDGWVQSARLVEGTAAATQRRSRAYSERLETRAIRLWAKHIGINLGERGRIPADLRERYRAEVGAQARERWTALAQGRQLTPET